MSDLFKLFIVAIYLFLVYKYYKNTVLLLLFTLALILILCNIQKIEEGNWVEEYSSADFDSINTFDNRRFNNNNNNNNNNVNVNRNNNNNNNNVNVNRNNNNNVNVNRNNNNNNINVNRNNGNKLRNIIPVSQEDYQMGPYDNLVLTTGNPKSEYVRLLNAPLASNQELCVNQGHENPLQCKKTRGLNIGPPIDGVIGSPQNMFMLSNNQASPNCCPSTFSTSTGCICTTENQRKFVNRRGMGTNPKPSETL